MTDHILSGVDWKRGAFRALVPAAVTAEDIERLDSGWRVGDYNLRLALADIVQQERQSEQAESCIVLDHGLARAGDPILGDWRDEVHVTRNGEVLLIFDSGPAVTVERLRRAMRATANLQRALGFVASGHNRRTLIEQLSEKPEVIASWCRLVFASAWDGQGYLLWRREEERPATIRETSV